jgi:hypothetical protein
LDGNLNLPRYHIRATAATCVLLICAAEALADSGAEFFKFFRKEQVGKPRFKNKKLDGDI